MGVHGVLVPSKVDVHLSKVGVKNGYAVLMVYPEHICFRGYH